MRRSHAPRSLSAPVAASILRIYRAVILPLTPSTLLLLHQCCVVVPLTPSHQPFLFLFVPRCMESQSQASNGVDYNAGTFIWTMHDYKGNFRCVVDFN